MSDIDTRHEFHKLTRIGELGNDSLINQGVFAEVYEQSELELCGCDVVQHLFHVRINKALDCFKFEQNFIEHHKISVILMCQDYPLILNCVLLFAGKWDLIKS